MERHLQNEMLRSIVRNPHSSHSNDLSVISTLYFTCRTKLNYIIHNWHCKVFMHCATCECIRLKSNPKNWKKFNRLQIPYLVFGLIEELSWGLKSVCSLIKWIRWIKEDETISISLKSILLFISVSKVMLVMTNNIQWCTFISFAAIHEAELICFVQFRMCYK